MSEAQFITLYGGMPDGSPKPERKYIDRSGESYSIAFVRVQQKIAEKSLRDQLDTDDLSNYDPFDS